jgi:hypothetical protein
MLPVRSERFWMNHSMRRLNEGILASSSESMVSTAIRGTKQEVPGVAVWAVVFPPSPPRRVR